MDRHALRLTPHAALYGLALGLALVPPAMGQLAPVSLPESLDTSNNAALLPPALAKNTRNNVFGVWHRRTATELQLVGSGLNFWGDPLAPISLIDTNVSPRGYDVAAVGSTSFVVVWVGPQGTPQPALLGARYAHGGAQQGETFVISPPSPEGFIPHRPSIACRPGRGCFVAWSIDLPPGGASAPGAVLGRRYDENLNPLGDAFVISQSAPEAVTEPQVAMSPGGRVVVAWPQQEVVFEGAPPIVTRRDVGTPTARYYGADGQALSNEIQLEVPNPAIDTDGLDVGWNDQNQVLAIWDRSGETDVPGVYGQLLSEVGAALGESRKLNRETSIFRGPPALSWDGESSRFAASWLGGRGAGASFRREVTLQLLDATGDFVGPEVPAVQALGSQELTPPSVAAASELNTFVGFSDAPNPATGRARVVQFSSYPGICESPIPVPFPVGPCTLIGRNNSNLLVMALYRGEDGRTAPTAPLDLTADTSAFFFRSLENPELFVKTVDGSGLNQRQWFFYGALSNQEYVISVFDGSGNTRAYYNPPGALASVGDTNALPIDDQLSSLVPSRDLATNREAESSPLGTCSTSGTSLCVLGGQFRLEVSWRDFEGNEGVGTAEQLTSDSGHFWFFAPENLELVVKMLDGRPVNGHFWLFYASLSNVEFTVRVFDAGGQLLKTYTNPPGTFASVADTGSL